MNISYNYIFQYIKEHFISSITSLRMHVYIKYIVRKELTWKGITTIAGVMHQLSIHISNANTVKKLLANKIKLYNVFKGKKVALIHLFLRF